MNDELHHFEPSCEELCPTDHTSFDHDAYCAWIDANHSLREDDVDSYYESRFDTGD